MIDKEFYIKQIRDTKRIVKKIDESSEFSLTMLINSLLSLVVLPYERAKTRDNSKVFPGSYKDLEKRIGVTPLIFQPIKSCEKCTPQYNNKTIYTFVNKLRNGIAYQNLDVFVDRDKTVYMIICNKYRCNNCKTCKEKTCTKKGVTKTGSCVKDFEISVTVKQLQKLSLYIADSYLKAIK